MSLGAVVLGVMLVASACSPASSPSSSPSSVPSPRPSVTGSPDTSSPSVEVTDPRRLRPSEWVLGPQGSAVLIFAGAARPRAVRAVLRDLADTPAAFALPGVFVKRHPTLIEEIVQADFPVINNGWTGEDLTALGRKELVRSIRRSDRVLMRAGAAARPFFLPPRGERGARVARIAGRRLSDGSPGDRRRHRRTEGGGPRGLGICLWRFHHRDEAGSQASSQGGRPRRTAS